MSDGAVGRRSFPPDGSHCGPVLLAQQLGARPDHLRGRRGRGGRGCAARSPSAPAPRDVAGAVRGGPGGASRRRRSDPRVRPDARRRPVRGSPGGGRRRRERDRDDVSAGATPGGTGPDALARAAPRLHRPCDPHVARGPGESRDATDDRPGGRCAAATLAPRRSGARLRPRSRPRRDCTWML